MRPRSPKVKAMDEESNTVKISVTLKPQQINGIAWLHHIEQSAIDSAVLSDNMGVRKTVTALTLVQVSADC